MSRNTNESVDVVEIDTPADTAPVDTENHTAEGEDVEGAEATVEVPNLEDVFDFQDGGSPYKLIKSANRAFEKLGIAKQLPTQMGYAYTKSGLIDGTKHNPTKGVTFTREVGLAWFAKYVSKNLSK